MPATVAIVVGQLVLAGPASAIRVGGAANGGSQGSAVVAPKAVNELDCNGWSSTYKPVRPAMRALCADPVLRRPGKKAARFIDNGWYVGHDEPSVPLPAG